MTLAQKFLEKHYPHVIAVDDLKHPAARGVALLLESNLYAGADLVQCRGGNVSAENDALLILDIHVPLGQRDRSNDIKFIEPVGITFRGESSVPTVFPLRIDFPTDVPHLNVTWENDPRSLCLFEMQPEEALRLATPLILIERIRFWMQQTAYGRLHALDQPLDPIIMSSGQSIILPEPHQKKATSQIFYGLRNSDRIGCPIVLVPAYERQYGNGTNGFSALYLTTKSMPNGRIRFLPRNLQELSSILTDLGFDLVSELNSLFESWLVNSNVRALLDQTCLILIRTPIEITPGSIHTELVKGFLLDCKASELARKVGSLFEAAGYVAPIIGGNPQKGETVDLSEFLLTVCDVYKPFDRFIGQTASGVAAGQDHSKAVTLIGAGAVGSQIAITAARMGLGTWTIVDPDFVMPHNMARHALGTNSIGSAKADALAETICSFLGPDAAQAFVEKIGEGFIDEEALNSARLVIDASASVPVSRWLAVTSSHESQTISVFLNPAGTDLVLLRESKGREVRLDHVEMSYYWGLISNKELASYLLDGKVGLYPSGGCRRPSLSLSQANLATLSGIAVRQIFQSEEPEFSAIEIWRAQPDAMYKISLPTYRYRESSLGDWTIVASETMLDLIAAARADAAANETGGILVGNWDRVRKRIYIVGIYGPPPDSKASSTGFIRGEEGVYETIEALEERTASNLTYIGEWHTHPPGHCSSPSSDDQILLQWIENILVFSDVPAVMLICGEDGVRILVGNTHDSSALTTIL